MTLVMLALILMYTCALLIKLCEMAPDVCVTFGFGGTANGVLHACPHMRDQMLSEGVHPLRNSGVYLFFIFFAIAMLLLLLVIYIANLYVAGRVPKFLLAARAHGVPPWTILRNVLARRQGAWHRTSPL